MNARVGLVSDWIKLEGDVITLATGKVELGQGAVTAIAQMGCHELGVDPCGVRILSGDTSCTPDEWYTAGSVSIEAGGRAMRAACAQARELALARAAQLRGIARENLDISAGKLVVGGQPQEQPASALLAQVDLDVPLDQTVPWRSGPGWIGRPLPRIDLPAKMAGGSFIHDVRLPGMLSGRVIRAPNRESRLLSVDREWLGKLPGVEAVVIDGSFIALAAQTESQAIAAAEAAATACVWDTVPAYPQARSVADLFAGLQVRTEPVLSAGEQPRRGGLRHESRFTKPAIAHASIGPSCAVATYDGKCYEVLTHSQGVFALRTALSRVLRVDPAEIVVRHVAGAGCYGHNGADDAALDACLIARSVPGRPVKVTWSRADELGAGPVGSPMMVVIEAGMDGSRIVDWRLQVWSGTHGARPGWEGAVNLLAATQLAQPFPPPARRDVGPGIGGGGERNACALYDFGRHEVLYHFAPDMPLRTSSLRALGSFANLFAIESFMDELADAAQVDSLQLRLDHLRDPRARDVLERVAVMAGWRAGSCQDASRSQGLAFGRYKNKAAYIAVVAQVEVGDDFRIERIWACVDAGLVVNPDGLVNQVEGGIVQALSWTLLEQVRFSTTRIESDSWEHYPILPFGAAPTIEVQVVNRPDEPPLGVGEVAQGPTAAAAANALSRALGVRLRDLPLTRENIIAAMD